MAISVDDLKHIIDTDMDDSALQSFIEDANLVVTEVLGPTPLSDARKDLITKYLAAHYVTITSENGGLKRSKLGEADESYVVNVGDYGFGTTRFGLQAMALDSTGSLAGMTANKGLKAQFRVV